MPLQTSRYRPISSVPGAVSDSVANLVSAGGELSAGTQMVGVSAHVQIAGVVLIVLLAVSILYARSLA